MKFRRTISRKLNGRVCDILKKEKNFAACFLILTLTAVLDLNSVVDIAKAVLRICHILYYILWDSNSVGGEWKGNV